MTDRERELEAQVAALRTALEPFAGPVMSRYLCSRYPHRHAWYHVKCEGVPVCPRCGAPGEYQHDAAPTETVRVAHAVLSTDAGAVWLADRRAVAKALLAVLGERSLPDVFRCPTCPERGLNDCCDGDCPPIGDDEQAVADALVLARGWQE